MDNTDPIDTPTAPVPGSLAPPDSVPLAPTQTNPIYTTHTTVNTGVLSARLQAAIEASKVLGATASQLAPIQDEANFLKTGTATPTA